MDRTTTPVARLLTGALAVLCDLVVLYAVASVFFIAQDGILRR